MFNFFVFYQLITVSLIHVGMEELAQLMAKDISDVVVLNDSLAISVNINEVIWKMSETFRFQAMDVVVVVLNDSLDITVRKERGNLKNVLEKYILNSSFH